MFNYTQVVEINKSNRQNNTQTLRISKLINNDRTAVMIDLYTGDRRLMDLVWVVREILDKHIYVSNISVIKNHNIFK